MISDRMNAREIWLMPPSLPRARPSEQKEDGHGEQEIAAEDDENALATRSRGEPLEIEFGQETPMNPSSAGLASVEVAVAPASRADSPRDF